MLREELYYIPELAKDIRRDESRLEYLRTKAEGDGSIRIQERVKTSPSNVSQVITEAMIDLAKEIERKQYELHRLRIRAAAIIEKLDGEEAEVMRLYYLRGLTWMEIAEVMAYDRATIFRRRDAAMERLFGSP